MSEARAKKEQRKLRVRQTRSANARSSDFRATLCALGLGRIGKSCDHKANSAVMGMIERVAAVVKVEII